MRAPLNWKVVLGMCVVAGTAALFVAWFRRLQAPEQAAWAQVVIGSVAAAVAIWAVRQPILANERMRVRAIEEAKADRARHASMLAGIWLDDLFDTLVRLRVAQHFLDDSATIHALLPDVLADLSKISAPTFLRSVERVDLFERNDGIIFGMAANRIMNIHRMGVLNQMLADENDEQFTSAWHERARPVVAEGVLIVAAAYKRSVVLSGHGEDNSEQAFGLAEAQFTKAEAFYLERIARRGFAG